MDAKVYISSVVGKRPVTDLFYDYFYALEAPVGSVKQKIKGGSIPQNLNKMVEQAKKGGFTHIFFVEDDSFFMQDTLMRLLKHDKEIVAGLCLSRQPPFRAYIYDYVNPDGSLHHKDIRTCEPGLIQCSALGMGGVLFKIDVFKKILYPWFETYFERRSTDIIEWGQDIAFAKKCIEHNIECFCDLTVRIHHVTDCHLSAEFKDGEWKTVIGIEQFNLAGPFMGGD